LSPRDADVKDDCGSRAELVVPFWHQPWYTLTNPNGLTLAPTCLITAIELSAMTKQAVPRRNEARVSARVPKEVQDRLQYAADLAGATLNQFLVQSALKEADAIIEQENLFVLSRRDAEVFFQALSNPPATPPAFKKAARRFAEKFDAANQRIEWSSRQRVVRLRKARTK
jgi:uncharacterized protein (DUF1778 family)